MSMTGPLVLGGGSSLLQSDFDDTVEVLAPDLWYKFQDASFATQIVDSSASDEPLIKQYSVAVAAANPLRSTQSQSGRFAANTSGETFTSNSPVYAHPDTDWTTAKLVAATTFCYQAAFRITGSAITQDEWMLFGAQPLFTTTNALLGLNMEVTNDLLEFRERHTSGGAYGDKPMTNAEVFDGDIHIIAAVYTPSYRKFYLDGVEAGTDTYGTALHTTPFAWSMGGSQNSTGQALQIDYDHHAVWSGVAPSTDQIIDMHTKYLAETI